MQLIETQKTQSLPRVILHPRQPHGVEEYLESLPDLCLFKPKDDAGVMDQLNHGAEILVTHIWRDDFLMSALRWVASTSAGYEQYPLAELQQRNVYLTTASGAASITVAEHAFALLLALTRRLVEFSQSKSERNWTPLVGDELFAKRLAIVGLGHIGEEVAKRAACWGMEIVGLKRNPCAYSGCVQDVRGMEELGSVCEWADILILCAPTAPGTAPLVSGAELQRLGAGYLVNVGRGGLVDQAALEAALELGKLLGAGLDVTTPEPLAEDSSLWSSQKVVLSAHSAGRSSRYGARWGAIFSRNLRALSGADEWINLVETKDGTT